MARHWNEKPSGACSANRLLALVDDLNQESCRDLNRARLAGFELSNQHATRILGHRPAWDVVERGSVRSVPWFPAPLNQPSFPGPCGQDQEPIVGVEAVRTWLTRNWTYAATVL
jgi:hypothetical protein